MRVIEMAAKGALISALSISCGGQSTAEPDANPIDAPPGMNSITGMVNGMPFTTPKTAFRIGSPDDAATTVVYMFDQVIQCNEITARAWDTRITNGTQILEIKTLGHNANVYAVPSKAQVNYTLSSTSGTPVESIASGVSATLEATAVTGGGAQGKFSFTFTNGQLDGSFDGTSCATGLEP